MAIAVVIDMMMNCLNFYGVMNGNLLIVRIITVCTFLSVMWNTMHARIGVNILWLIFMVIHMIQLMELKQLNAVNSAV